MSKEVGEGKVLHAFIICVMLLWAYLGNFKTNFTYNRGSKFIEIIFQWRLIDLMNKMNWPATLWQNFIELKIFFIILCVVKKINLFGSSKNFNKISFVCPFFKLFHSGHDWIVKKILSLLSTFQWIKVPQKKLEKLFIHPLFLVKIR